MGSSTITPVWIIDPESDQEVSVTISEARAKKVYEQAKESVTQNPITNPLSKHLKSGKHKGMYRWKKTKHNPYRLIYGADKSTRIVYPAIFDTRGNIRYD